MVHPIPPGPTYNPDFVADMVTIYDSLAIVLTAMSTNSGLTAVAGGSIPAITAWLAASNLIMLKYRVAALEEVMPPAAVAFVKTEFPARFDPDKLFFIDSTPLTSG